MMDSQRQSVWIIRLIIIMAVLQCKHSLACSSPNVIISFSWKVELAGWVVRNGMLTHWRAEERSFWSDKMSQSHRQRSCRWIISGRRLVRDTRCWRLLPVHSFVPDECLIMWSVFAFGWKSRDIFHADILQPCISCNYSVLLVVENGTICHFRRTIRSMTFSVL